MWDDSLVYRLIEAVIVIIRASLLKLLSCVMMSGGSLLHDSGHGFALKLFLLNQLLLHGITDLHLLFQVVIVFTGSFGLVIGSRQHLWGLLLRGEDLIRHGLWPTHTQGALRANSGRTTNLRLRTRRFLHARLEIVHVALTLVDFLDSRDLFLGLRHVEVTC